MGDRPSRSELRSIARLARKADRLDERWFGGPRPRQQLTGAFHHELMFGCSWVGPMPTADEQLGRRRGW